MEDDLADGGSYIQGQRVGRGDGTGFEKWLACSAQGTGMSHWPQAQDDPQCPVHTEISD